MNHHREAGLPLAHVAALHELEKSTLWSRWPCTVTICTAEPGSPGKGVIFPGRGNRTRGRNTLDVFQKNKREKGLCLVHSLQKESLKGKGWEGWIGVRSHEAQKDEVRKLYFIPSMVGSHWRTFFRGESSDLRFIYSCGFISLPLWLSLFYHFPRVYDLGRLSFETSFSKWWTLKTEKSSDNIFRCSD